MPRSRTTFVGLLLATAAGFLPLGCQSVVTVPVPSALHSERTQKEAGLSPSEQAWAEQNCFEGEPESTQPMPGANREVARKGYVLLHSSFYRLPLWVCEGLRAAQFEGSEARSNHFFADPKLPTGERSELKDYSGSGFDRGHQAPAGDFNQSKQLKDETFSLANMAPQTGKGFNQDIWRMLEDFARDLVKASGHGYIITGPMFYDVDEESGSGKADGLVNVRWIGHGRVAVPTHFYKIVITFDHDTPRCVAFVMENKKYVHATRYNFRPYIKSVAWIEARTGLNFMPDLPANLVKQLERTEGSAE
jgi:endonuclease G